MHQWPAAHHSSSPQAFHQAAAPFHTCMHCLPQTHPASTCQDWCMFPPSWAGAVCPVVFVYLSHEHTGHRPAIYSICILYLYCMYTTTCIHMWLKQYRQHFQVTNVMYDGDKTRLTGTLSSTVARPASLPSQLEHLTTNHSDSRDWVRPWLCWPLE